MQLHVKRLCAFLMLPFILIASPSAIEEQKQMVCSFDTYELRILFKGQNVMRLQIFENQRQHVECSFSISSYDDGKKSASLAEIIHVDLMACVPSGARSEPRFAILPLGYLKSFPPFTSYSVYIIQNQHPLVCSVEP